jgi:hypothetical protein
MPISSTLIHWERVILWQLGRPRRVGTNRSGTAPRAGLGCTQVGASPRAPSPRPILVATKKTNERTNERTAAPTHERFR